MSLDFSNIKNITITEGAVKLIKDSNNNILWQGGWSLTVGSLVDSVYYTEDSPKIVEQTHLGIPPYIDTQYIWEDEIFLYYSFQGAQWFLIKGTEYWNKRTWTLPLETSYIDGRYVWTDGDNIYYSNKYILNKQDSSWHAKTFYNLPTSFYANYAWTDGENIYYSYGATQYVLDKSTSTWYEKTWNGLTSFYGSEIWTDGTNYYIEQRVSLSYRHYVLDKSTSTWNTKTWSGFSPSASAPVWTDGTNVYYSSGTTQKILNKSTGVWSDKTWYGLTDFSGNLIWKNGTSIYLSNSGLTYKLNTSNSTWQPYNWPTIISMFSGENVWTDGNNTYFSQGNLQYIWSIGNQWQSKTWYGLTNFDGRYIWTDGDNIYYSNLYTNYVLNKSTSTWSTKTWYGETSIYGNYVWTDGTDIYYSLSSVAQYVLNKSTSTWSSKSWSGMSSFYGHSVWKDGTNIYYSNGTDQYVLNKLTSTWSRKTWYGLTDFYATNIFYDGTNVYLFKSASNIYKLNSSSSTWQSIQIDPIVEKKIERKTDLMETKSLWKYHNLLYISHYNTQCSIALPITARAVSQASSSVSFENLNSDEKVYIGVKSYTDEPEQYTYEDHNFYETITSANENDIVVYRNATAKTYTTKIIAGSYVNTVRARISGGTWSSAQSSVSISHPYNSIIEWEAVDYTPSGSTYAYVGAISGTINNKCGSQYTVNRYRRNSLTVVWKDWNGTILKTDNYFPSGSRPEYTGTTPTRARDEHYTYKFIGWAPAIDEIYQNTTYTAVYSATGDPCTLRYFATYSSETSLVRDHLSISPSLSMGTTNVRYNDRYSISNGTWQTTSTNFSTLIAPSGSVKKYWYSSAYEYTITNNNSFTVDVYTSGYSSYATTKYVFSLSAGGSDICNCGQSSKAFYFKATQVTITKNWSTQFSVTNMEAEGGLNFHNYYYVRGNCTIEGSKYSPGSSSSSSVKTARKVISY